MTGDELDDETRHFLCDEARLHQFCEALRQGKRWTVSDTALWSALANTYRDLPTGPERRRWLLTVLEAAAERGLVRLPVRHGKRWDRSSVIALPREVKVVPPVAEATAAKQWRQFPWHTRLQWVLQLRSLAADQITFLQRVHEGLVEGWFHQPECFKYRSLQLTGDEKRLNTLLKGSLFGPERVTLSMLGCEPEALPLATEFLSPHPRMLVFENAAPFMLARTIAAYHRPPLIGRLAYGAGKQILKAIDYFSMIAPPITEILYVGDIDAEGLRIAVSVQRRSQAVAVRPAVAFHQAMLASAAALGAPTGWPAMEESARKLGESALQFLSADIRRRCGAMIAVGRRIPEEVLSCAAMTELLQSA
jgi:hypothetical protein